MKLSARLAYRLAPIYARALLAILAAPAAAQDPTLILARTLVEAETSAVDDPVRDAETLLTAALVSPRSPVACALVAEARQRLLAGKPTPGILTLLGEVQGSAPRHGLLQLELDELRDEILLRSGQPRSAATYASFAASIQVVGPFGDSGRHYLDVWFAPEARFPAAMETLAGRFGEVRVRTLQRDHDRRGFDLQGRAAQRAGSHFVLWRVAAVAATSGFLEVDYRGSFWARIDGTEVGRSDPYLAPQPRVKRWPIQLGVGVHEILIKTGDDSDSPLGLRCCDAAGSGLAQVSELAASATASEAAPGPSEAAPGPSEAAPGAGDPRHQGSFRDAATTLAEAAATAEGHDRATLRLAAVHEFRRAQNTDAAVTMLRQLEQDPPTDPSLQLAFAELWLRATEFPDEIRNAKARALVALATKDLPLSHHQALLARVRKFEDQDQREQALRLLRAEIDAGRAGPMTFATTNSVLRALHFQTEVPNLLQQWSTVCPGDVRPLLQLADHHAALGDVRRSFAFVDRARALLPADSGLLRRAVLLALDLGDVAYADMQIDAMEQRLPAGKTPLWLMNLRLTMAQSCGDKTAQRAALTALAQHEDANANTHAEVAAHLLQLDADSEAITRMEASLALDADQRNLRVLREALGGAPAEGADFARFRKDGDAAIAAFTPGESERGASTSMLVDQRIVELLPDGSHLVEIHELRAVNDLQGVEALRAAEAPARASELLLLRTVGKDGKTYIPSRVEGGFSMPRLEPGAFVEWRYRDHHRASGAEPWRLDDFLFASQQEALEVTEWILIVHKGSRGELRLRNLGITPETLALDGDRTAYIVRRNDVARLPQESSPPPSEEMIPMAGYGEDADAWPQLRSERAAMLWRTHPTPVVVDFASELLQGLTTDSARIARIVEFCQRDIADGEGSDATEVLLRKKGNRYLLTLALLRAAEVPLDFAACEIALPEVTGNGPPLFATGDRTGLPCARLRPRDGAAKWLFYDTPRYWPLGEVPAHRSGALAYVIGADAAEQIRLPLAIGAVQDLAIDASCTFGDDGTRMSAAVRLLGHSGFSVAEQIRKIPGDRQKLAARQLGQQFLEGWRIRSAACSGLEPAGQPLQLDLEVTGPAAQADGAGRWLATLPLPPMSLRASFGDRDHRQLPLHQQTDLQFHHRVRMEAGDGRAFAELPSPRLHSFGPLDYQLTFARDGKAVVVDRRVRLHPAVIEPSVYADWIRILATIDRAEEKRLLLIRTTRG